MEEKGRGKKSEMDRIEEKGCGILSFGSYFEIYFRENREISTQKKDFAAIATAVKSSHG